MTPDAISRYAATGGEVARIPEMAAEELGSRTDSAEGFVLDVRRAVEFREAHIPDAMNAARTRLIEKLDALQKDRGIYVYCRSGIRSGYASAMLRARGFDAINMVGGYDAWANARTESL